MDRKVAVIMNHASTQHTCIKIKLFLLLILSNLYFNIYLILIIYQEDLLHKKWLGISVIIKLIISKSFFLFHCHRIQSLMKYEY